jgi:hypothetical protein
MSRRNEHLDPDRLVAAAEAALRAAVDVAEYTGGPWPYPADLMGSPLQPEFLSEFTRWEIEQACEFLVRLGAIERRTSERKAG